MSIDFGPHLYGATLHINEPVMFNPNSPVSLDVETDEQDNFVGVGMCQSSTDIYYWGKDQWCDELADFIGTFNFIMQGGAFDIRMLKKWGVDTDYSRLLYDTKIMAYTIDSTRLSYGLKSMAESILHLKWPTYKEMVGTGKKKITLDKQPVEKVAAYCGMDTLAEYKLYQYFSHYMNSTQLEYFSILEMPLYRLLSEMEDKGVHVDVPYLKELGEEWWSRHDELDQGFKALGLNPRSPKQLLEALRSQGLPITKTDSKTLEPHKKDWPLVRKLLIYRKYKKLESTYISPFLKSFTLPRLHGRFIQKTITGRLASAKPNLQNIPIRTDEGKKIRKAFTPAPEHTLLVLDYSQIEYRLFAHFTQDSTLLEAYKNDKDIHEATAQLIGADRTVGKTLNFAAIYGAQAKRIGETAGIDEESAQLMLNSYWNKMPDAALWVSKTKWLAKKNGGVVTLFNRFIPLIGLKSSNKFEQLHALRVAVNAIIQGSAAEIMKKAMLDIKSELGLVPVLQVHDELVYEIHETDDLTTIEKNVRLLMENVVELSIPLKVSGGYGKSWAEAK